MKNKSLFWIFALSIVSYFMQGIEGLPSQALFVFMKNTLGLTPSQIMYLGAVTGLAWLIKPLWGMLIDSFFTKKIWYLSALILSFVICLINSIYALPLTILIMSFIFSSLGSSIRDISVDGMAVMEGQNNDVSDKLQASQWISITVASLIVGLLGGFIAQKMTYQIGFLCLLPLYVVAFIFVCRYKVSKTEKINIEVQDYKKLFTNKSFLITCLFMFFYCYSPSFGTPLSFIQRDVFKWNETWIGLFGAIISCLEIVGAIIFYKFSKKISLKKWLTWSVWFGAITSLCYLWYTPKTAILYGVVFSIVGMWIHLIVLTVMAKSCVKGLESTSFATLCAIHNLAGTFSSLSGAWLFPLVGLPTLIILSSVTSFICLFWINHLPFNKIENQLFKVPNCKCH